MWEFSVGLYMINIWPDSLLLTAVYVVVEASSTALFGPIIGKLVNRLSYVQVLRLWLLTQNLSFIVAGVTVTWLLVHSGLRLSGFSLFISLVVLTNVSGAISTLSTLSGTILVEREWVIVIAKGEPPKVLSNMNSVIRRIDLSCKLFAPVASGFIISFISVEASAVALALWNVTSVWLQYWLLKSVYDGIPALSENDRNTKARFEQKNQVEVSSSVSTDTEILLSYKGSSSALEEHSWKHKVTKRLSKVAFFDAWIVYLRQDVVLPGVALSLLYFSVLSFGTLMTATLEWKGIPAYVIGIVRGISATVGIAATLLYPILHSRISTPRTGLWSIWTQIGTIESDLDRFNTQMYSHQLGLLFLELSATMRCFCMDSKQQYPAWMLMGGVSASRLGLWMFDLSVMQQMQDQVPDSDRCIVGGVQNSLQSILHLLSYVSGIIISNPEDFGKLTILSVLSTMLAALLYTFHVYRVRKHLFHFRKLRNGESGQGELTEFRLLIQVSNIYSSTFFSYKFPVSKNTLDHLLLATTS
ncbi:hypothetical protein C5167_024978 [Papaver somniferum]|uniref:Solute carrier family 40 member n=1 Tax=Papaver somniferum TaxID=3469 RepID=A0A4Y7JRQ2_PAPSO|nr:hypothetical protein C5167_024978 [Papaver somniferum]